MKTIKAYAIRRLRRWADTILGPQFAEQKWRDDDLARRLSELIESTNRLSREVHELVACTLHSIWRQDELQLRSRDHLGHWLNHHRLFGEGVEVGVFRGEFSERILDSWRGARLYSVDPWLEHSAEEYNDVCNCDQTAQDANYEMAVERLRRFRDRSCILRLTSEEAARNFAEGSLDSVYIDAQHHYDAVKQDIHLWYPKVKGGGVISGHDYLDGKLASGLYGVKKAVDEFVAQNDLRLILSQEDDYPSWFILKPR